MLSEQNIHHRVGMYRVSLPVPERSTRIKRCPSFNLLMINLALRFPTSNHFSMSLFGSVTTNLIFVTGSLFHFFSTSSIFLSVGPKNFKVFFSFGPNYIYLPLNNSSISSNSSLFTMDCQYSPPFSKDRYVESSYKLSVTNRISAIYHPFNQQVPIGSLIAPSITYLILITDRTVMYTKSNYLTVV